MARVSRLVRVTFQGSEGGKGGQDGVVCEGGESGMDGKGGEEPGTLTPESSALTLRQPCLAPV